MRILDHVNEDTKQMLIVIEICDMYLIYRTKIIVKKSQKCVACDKGHNYR